MTSQAHDVTARPTQGRSESIRLASSVVLVAAMALTAAWFGAPRPFVWTWLLAMLLALLNVALATSGRVRGAALVLFGLSLSMCLLESGFALYDTWNTRRAAKRGAIYSNPGFFINEPDLGYAAGAGIRTTARKSLGAKNIYDVVYTISDQGVRATKGNPKGDTWLFMGCSYTFGEGVNDDETLPAHFSAELGYGANVVNLGFPGYGPHQMLRALEVNRIPPVRAAVKHVIYQGAVWHVRRAKGRVSWDLNGPSYSMTRQTVSYTGPFRSRGGNSLRRFVEKSDLARFFMRRQFFNENVSDEDIELYARIVERSEELARGKLGAGFMIIFWDDDSEPARRVLARLQKSGIPMLRVSEVIPEREWPDLRIVGDSHPTPEAYRRLAAGLAQRFNAQASGAGAKN